MLLSQLGELPFGIVFVFRRVLTTQLDALDLLELLERSGLLGEGSDLLNLLLVEILLDLVHFLDVLLDEGFGVPSLR